MSRVLRAGVILACCDVCGWRRRYDHHTDNWEGRTIELRCRFCRARVGDPRQLELFEAAS